MENGENYLEMKSKFENKLKSFKKSTNSILIESREKYDKIIKEVEDAKKSIKKKSIDYRRLKRYDIVLIDGFKRLIVPGNKEGGPEVVFLNNDELFDIIHEAHIEYGHGGRNKLEKILNKKYANITRESISNYLQLCVACEKKRNNCKKYVTSKQLLREINSCAQVDIIDMETYRDDTYKFILYFQDHQTKFIVLKPLKTNEMTEIAKEVLDTFCLLGIPMVVHSGDGRKFAVNLVDELKKTWPELTIVHGEKRENLEALKSKVKQTLVVWMEKMKIKNWSDGLKFFQLQTNNNFCPNIKQTPFEAMFGRRKNHELHSLPDSIKNFAQTEEELEEALDSYYVQNLTEEDEPAILKVKTHYEMDEMEESSKSTYVCCVCGQETSSVQKCSLCFSHIHVNCGRNPNEEGENFVLCFLCSNKEKDLAPNRTDAGC